MRGQMRNNQRHILADFVCVTFLLIGLLLLFVRAIHPIFSIIFLVTGIIGMMLNEKLNPFQEVSDEN